MQLRRWQRASARQQQWWAWDANTGSRCRCSPPWHRYLCRCKPFTRLIEPSGFVQAWCELVWCDNSFHLQLLKSICLGVQVLDGNLSAKEVVYEIMNLPQINEC